MSMGSILQNVSVRDKELCGDDNAPSFEPTVLK